MTPGSWQAASGCETWLWWPCRPRRGLTRRGAQIIRGARVRVCRWHTEWRGQGRSIHPEPLLPACLDEMTWLSGRMLRTSDSGGKRKWYGPGVGRLLVVLCRSNVAKSLSVPTQLGAPYFYIKQPLKNGNSFKRIICFYLIKDSIFYEIIITVLHVTQCAIGNRSTCHAWHACRRLPTSVLIM